MAIPLIASARAVAAWKRRRDIPSAVDQLRRLTYSRYWEREDPPTRLAPGSSRKRTVKTVVGTTEELVRQLSTEIGFSGSGQLQGVSARIGGELQTRLSLSMQREESDEVNMTGPDSGPKYYALWRVKSRLTVESAGWDGYGDLPWARHRILEWYESSAASTTAFPSDGNSKSDR